MHIAGNGWNGNDVFYTFLRLRRESDMDKVNDNIQRVIEKYTETTIDDWKMDYSIIPLVKRHLDSPDVQKRLVIYGFLGFAIFFVAIMNYMLISIATLSRRQRVWVYINVAVPVQRISSVCFWPRREFL